MNPILIGLWWSKILYTLALESGTTHALIQTASTEHQLDLRLSARQSVQCQRSPDRTATPTEFVAWWQKWQRNGSKHCDSAGTLAEKAKSLVRVYRPGQLTKTWDARSVFPELADKKEISWAGWGAQEEEGAADPRPHGLGKEGEEVHKSWRKVETRMLNGVTATRSWVGCNPR